MTTQKVLVTGGSGFIAGHIIIGLLAAGHEVRSTVRSLKREDEVRAHLVKAGMTRGNALTFVEADLMADAGWADATAGMDVVVHTASPVLPETNDADLVIKPAREGTARVLAAAMAAGVKRVVLTSAFHAVGFGHTNHPQPYTEADWSPLGSRGLDAYGQAKTLAEQDAWRLVEGSATELVTLCPVAVMGPLLGNDASGSNHIIKAMLGGAMPAVPHVAFPIVDVRDVAAAHVAAVTAPDAAGKRILVAANEPAMPMADIAAMLRKEFGEAAAKAPTRTIPDLVVRVVSVFRPQYRSIANDLGTVKRVDISRLTGVLGVQPRPSRDAIVAAGRSLLERGVAS